MSQVMNSGGTSPRVATSAAHGRGDPLSRAAGGTRRSIPLRAFPLLAAIATTGLLSGCGAVRLNGVEVDKEVAFLAVVEQQWRGDEHAGADPYAATAKHTSCWLARDRDSGAVQTTAFCGPIRHLAGGTSDGIFDQITFHPEFVGNQVQVDPEAVELTATGVAAPTGLQLYSPRAGKPAAPEDVPVPEAPRAAAGLVTTVSDGLIENATVPSDSLLIAPNLLVSITKTGTVSSVPGGGEGTDSAPYYRPADGQEFLAFTIHRDVRGQFDESYVATSINLSATYTARSAAGQTDLAGLFADDNDTDTTVVMSVPVGQDAELVVGVAGVDQALSVRTGRRTSVTADAYYRRQTSAAVQKQYSNSFSKGDFSIRHGVTFTDATLSAFNPSRGWAPSGQMYLTVYCQNVQLDNSSYGYAPPSFNTKKSVTATTTENEKVGLLGGFPGSDLETNLDRLTFLVPQGTTGIKIHYQPTGTFAVNSMWDPGDFSPDHGSFSLKSKELDIKFD